MQVSLYTAGAFGGCVASTNVGCIPGAVAGVTESFLIDTWLSSASPLSSPENFLGLFSLATTVATDSILGNNNPIAGQFSIGNDTLVSFRNFGVGLFPESILDYLISRSQLKYDLDRMTGVKQGGTIQLTSWDSLRQVFRQILLSDW